MSTPKDGGPAFPHSFESAHGHPRWHESQGATLRDYFAAAALTGIIAAPNSPAGDWRRCAADAYAAADAMLSTRTPESQGDADDGR